MQYDIDMNGACATLFKSIRQILLSYANVTEQKNPKQTSYSDEYGVVVMIRSRGDVLVLAFGRGVKLQEKYPQLKGSGKVVRHLYLQCDEKIDEMLLRGMIEESFVLGMEAFEMKRLRKYKC